MLILDAEQVQYCPVIATIEGQSKTESGLIYQNNVFLKLKTYSREDLQIAIKECREDYLDNKEIEVSTLIIKAEQEVTLWLEDKRFKPEKGQNLNLPPKQNEQLAQKSEQKLDKLNLRDLISQMRG